MTKFPLTLVVFDFDGTLFLSPEPPAGENPGTWWTSSKSLASPCVPEEPGVGWWNASVVEKAKQAMENPDIISVLITGRLKSAFSLRLKQLLSQAGLKFHHIYMSSGGRTDQFKVKAIDELLSEYPTIRGVSIWEDNAVNLRMYADWVESQGRACFPHLITVSAAASECGPSSAMRVAAQYQEKKKVKTKDGDESTVYVYSERQVANRNKEKAKQVEKLRNSIGDLRSCVKKDMKSDDTHKSLVALAVALMDHSIERVGNHESAKDGHYGVTGWTVGHITIKGDKAVIKYTGKSGVEHEKTIEEPSVVSAMKPLLKDKKDGDRLLESGDVGVDPEDVNAYLAKFDVTAKDIRGYRANDEMCKALKAERAKGPELPKDKKEKEEVLKKEFKKVLEEVADIVGHTPTMLKNSYLVPGLEDSYLKDGTVLKSLKVSTKTRGEKEDEAADALIKPSPKHKPPRHDLRNRQTDVDDDPDADKPDPDTSRNYKRVASAYLDQVSRCLVYRGQSNVRWE